MRQTSRREPVDASTLRGAQKEKWRNGRTASNTNKRKKRIKEKK